MKQRLMGMALAICLVAWGCGMVPAGARGQTTQPANPGANPGVSHLKTEIKPYHGAPTLYINGQPNAGLTYMSYKPQGKYYEAFGKIGVDLASVMVTADFALYGAAAPLTWRGPGDYDYSDIDRKMNMIVAANPNAYILPRVYMCSPTWWDKQHPDELVKWDDGKTEKDVSRGKTTLASWASEEYRKASAENLRRFIQHVRQQPYAGHIIGYHVASGEWEEWFYWESETNEMQDYSQPMVQAFRKWLGQKYTSDEGLQKAWNKPDAKISEAAIPTAGQRSGADFYIWRNPAQRQNVIDFYTFYCEVDISLIKLMARTVKEETHGEQICGVFYGYELNISGENRGQNTGHLALHNLIQCPDIDFFTAPTLYAYREVGTGYSATQSPTDPMKLWGKYFFDENDVRTHLLPRTAGYGRTADLADTIALQTRQLGTWVTHGWGAWWFDMGGGWYDDPKVMESLQKLNAIGENSINFDRSDTAEIAVVIDEHSMFYQGLKATLTGPLVNDQILPLGKMGATYDWVFLDDLDKAQPYKFYIFLNTFHVDANQKAAVDRLKGRGAKAILWMYGAGYAGEKALDIKGSTELTGINLKAEDSYGPMLVRINREGAAALPGVPEDTVYGARADLGPAIFAADPEVETLGTLEGHNAPGLVLKKINGLDVYFSSGFTLPSNLLRALAGRAGVHIYSTKDDAFTANKSFLSIHTATAGVRHISLPEKTDVYDTYNDKVIARNTTGFDVDLPARTTVVYFLGSEEQWKKGK